MEQKNMGYPHSNLYPHVPPPLPTTIITAMPAVGPDSTPLICPHCHANIQTRVDKESTTRTHLIALFLCIFLCWPCVCVPYCMDSCKNANHYCPNCHAFLGTYQA